MRGVLEALKAILDELGVDVRMETSSKRQKIQKAIYLCKIAGVDIGYYFGFYAMGVYSPELVADCHELVEHITDKIYNIKLNERVMEKLKIVRSMMEVPDAVDLAQWEWMELLTSVHYLRDNYSLDCVSQKMYKYKSNYVDFVESAEFVLHSHGLILT